MTAPHSPPRPDDTAHKTDLNPTHVAAGALAAVTAAVLGSELGTTGTLIGAAGGSMITTVGTAVYESSLQRSRQSVRSLAPHTRSLPTSPKDSWAEHSHPSTANAPFSDEQLNDSNEDQGPLPGECSRRRAALRWGTVVVAAIGAFVLAMMLITGFEWVSGQAIGGNGKGTTIEHVVNNPPGPRAPATPPAPHDSGGPASEIPTQTPKAPDTSTTNPHAGTGGEPSPPKTSDTPTPSEVTPIPPVLPTKLPGVGG